MARALLFSRRQVYVLTLYATRCRTTPPIHGGPKAGRDPHSQGTQLCLKASGSRHFGAGSALFLRDLQGAEPVEDSCKGKIRQQPR